MDGEVALSTRFTRLPGPIRSGATPMNHKKAIPPNGTSFNATATVAVRAIGQPHAFGSGLCRLAPADALQAMCSGAALIDIRSEWQIARDGTIAGALVIARNVLEWRLDPASQHRYPQAPRLADLVIVLCDQGYQSSLAAATL